MKSWNKHVRCLREIMVKPKEPRIVIFHGPDGMGKTVSGKIFCKWYRGHYFSFRNLDAPLALHFFDSNSKSWGDFFNILKSKERRPVIFFDDVDDRNDKDDFLNALYSCVDQNMFVVLCCRKPMKLQCETSSLSAKPMTVTDVQSSVRCIDRLDTLRLFALTGGIPELVDQYDMMQSFRENLKSFFTSGSEYLTYAERRMRQEFRSPESYNTLLFGIAQGHQRISQLAEFSGYPKNKVDKYLKALMEAGLIFSHPHSCKNGQRRTHYVFQNSYWEIWYRYYFPVQMGSKSRASDDVLQSWMNEIDETFVIDCYRDLCFQWVKHIAIRELILDDTALRTRNRKQVGGVVFDYYKATPEQTTYAYIWPSLTEPFPREIYKKIITVTTLNRPFYKNHYFIFSSQLLPRFLVSEREKYSNVHATDLRGLIWNR